MRRWTTLSIVAAMTACQGGAHEMGAGAVQRAQTNAQHNGPPVRIARAETAPPRSDAPTLVNVAGRGVSTPTVASVDRTAGAAGSTGAPPSGGFIVRSTTPHAAPTYAAAPPPPTTVAPMHGTASPSNGGGRMGSTGHGSGYRVPAEPTPRPVAASSTTRRSRHAEGASGGATAALDSAAGESAGYGGLGLSGTGFGGGGGGASVAAAAPPSGGMMIAPAPTPAAVAPVGPGSTHVTIAVTTTPAAPPPVAEMQQVETAGLLTAASVGDADRRGNYLEYLARHGEEASDLAIDMTRRVRFRVVDAQGRAINDARVSIGGDGVQFAGRTHADGGWDFFPSMIAPQFAGNVTVRADVENVGTQAVVNIPAQGDAQGPVVLQIPAIIAPPPAALDLGFVIDVTGSMGDELSYVNREIGTIVQRIEAQAPGTRVRVSATFYRDRVDSLLVQQIPFTDNVPGFASVMQGVSASGGGDYPEDMNAGLEAAMTRLTWSEGAASRVMVLIADAPPQPYQDESFTYRTAMLDASRRGIRILPVAASGADRTVEYLFRAMGAMTSTPYVYLTDDSGVGAAHMEADTDRVAVERFNDLLVRMVLSDLHGEGMHEPGPLAHEG